VSYLLIKKEHKMKLFTLFLLMLLGFAQFIMAQDTVETTRLNSMSNVIGVTVEGGTTFGITDYNISKVDYTVKGSLEYYFPSSGSGNLGARVFGQTGYVAGRGAPAGAFNPTNEFSTRIDILGGALMYLISLDNEVYLWLSAGASNIWFYPYDGNGNKLPNYAAGNYSTFMLALNGDAGVKVKVSRNMTVDLSGGVVFGKKDYLDDIKSGANSDMFFTASVGASYYFGRREKFHEREVPHGITKVYLHDTVVVTQHDTVVVVRHDTVVITPPVEVEIKNLVLSGDENFEFNKAILLPNAFIVLDRLVKTMNRHTDFKWEIDGYTDGIGSANYNLKLSKRRAQAVVDYLVSKGVDRNNLKIVGYGKEHPIATNETLEGRSMNRRVEIKLLTHVNQ
jgi:outer membrane protein OmpA-like peptidoglycan-associated protein